MPRPLHNRFTVYDALEAKGVFAANPANAGSVTTDGQVLYAGPVEFPKMYYHPSGATRITVPATPVVMPDGVKYVGEQKEIIWRVAGTAAEGAKLEAAGWHDHPAKAIEAGGGEAPATGMGDVIRKLERELALAKGQIAERDAKLAELE